jgi:HD-GYP domain-containing protein (c-di-GMP phosphodiesterase class II)
MSIARRLAILVAAIAAAAAIPASMVSDRPYRRGITPATARSILRQGAGTQRDPVLVRLFLAGPPAPISYIADPSR